jgi:hypothetical protein
MIPRLDIEPSTYGVGHVEHGHTTRGLHRVPDDVVPTSWTGGAP